MIEELGFVKASRYRENIVRSLAESVKTPKALSDELGIHQNNVSKTLKELTGCGLVECINPEIRKGKLFRLTDAGVEVFENM